MQRLSSHSLTVHASVYEIRIDNADAYVDLQAVRVRCQKCVMDELRPEGLLGRTWEKEVDEPNNEDELKQYRERDGRLTGCNYERQKFCNTEQGGEGGEGGEGEGGQGEEREEQQEKQQGQ